MEFTRPQWQGLSDHARRGGTDFSVDSIFRSRRSTCSSELGVPAWKVGSGEVTNLPMLRADGDDRPAGARFQRHGLVGRAGRRRGHGLGRRRAGRTLAMHDRLSLSGRESWAQCDRPSCAIGTAARSACPTTRARSTPRWPPRRWAPTCWKYTSCCRANVLVRTCSASVTTAELAQLVEGVRFIERALAHPLDKQQMAGEMADAQVDVRQERGGRPRPAGGPRLKRNRSGAEETGHGNSRGAADRSGRPAAGAGRDRQHLAGGGIP